MSRIRDPKFVSVNGIMLPKGRRHLDLPPGAQDVEIRFALPETNELSAKLRFHARAKNYYTVRFETFPHGTGRIFSSYGNKGDGRGDIIGVPIWLAYNLVAQSAYEARERGMAVSWTKIDVISADPTEGTVASSTVKGSVPKTVGLARKSSPTVFVNLFSRPSWAIFWHEKSRPGDRDGLD